MLIRILLVSYLSVCAFALNADDVDDQSIPLAGAYQKVKSLDDNIQQAAAFAAQQINKGDLVDIQSAESQVVAGTNYRFKLLISMADGTQHIFNAVVFKPLPYTGDSLQLVSYEDMGVYPTVQ